MITLRLKLMESSFLVEKKKKKEYKAKFPRYWAVYFPIKLSHKNVNVMSWNIAFTFL